VLDGRGGRVVLGAAIGAALVNAVVSLLQAAGVWQPFAVEAIAGRVVTGAFMGNEGQLALTLALAAVAGLAVRAGWPPVVAAAGLTVLGAALVINATISALAAVAAGVATVLAAERGWRGMGAALGIGILLCTAAAAWAPLRTRVLDAIQDARRGSWDDLTSNRLGPWAAALEMIRARPLAGSGPGSFPVEFVPRRLEAEIRHRTRLVIPRITSSYGEAHDEYLQAAAELGVPTAAALAAAAAAVIVGLVRRLRAAAGGARVEATALLALLLTGAVAALTWFPFQRPASVVPLLLAWGRAWRMLG
jgi:O-antigen ligase